MIDRRGSSRSEGSLKNPPLQAQYEAFEISLALNLTSSLRSWIKPLVHSFWRLDTLPVKATGSMKLAWPALLGLWPALSLGINIHKIPKTFEVQVMKRTAIFINQQIDQLLLQKRQVS
jgi:hypothetical protein